MNVCESETECETFIVNYRKAVTGWFFKVKIVGKASKYFKETISQEQLKKS